MGEGRSLPQFIGATNDGYYALPNRGMRSEPLYQQLARAKTLSLEDGVRHTPRPLQRKVRMTGDEVSYLDWITGLRPVLAAREIA